MITVHGEMARPGDYVFIKVNNLLQVGYVGVDDSDNPIAYGSGVELQPGHCKPVWVRSTIVDRIIPKQYVTAEEDEMILANIEAASIENISAFLRNLPCESL